MKWTKQTIARAVRKVNESIAAFPDAGRFGLIVPHGATRVDDDWLLVVVEPTAANVRAYDYVERLAEVESKLRADGLDHVTVVPAMAG